MNPLRVEIMNLRRRNTMGQLYVPHGPLLRLLTEAAIRSALLHEKVSRWRVRKITSSILHGKQKAFAILVFSGHGKSVVKLIEADGLQHSPLDHMLPLDYDKLQDIFGESVPARHFYDEQWQFLSPILSESVHRQTIDSRLALPFIDERQLGAGGFGRVIWTQIDDSHHTFDTARWKAVCSQFLTQHM
jgi:hypothetical protein